MKTLFDLPVPTHHLKIIQKKVTVTYVDKEIRWMKRKTHIHTFHRIVMFYESETNNHAAYCIHYNSIISRNDLGYRRIIIYTAPKLEDLTVFTSIFHVNYPGSPICKWEPTPKLYI